MDVITIRIAVSGLVLCGLCCILGVVIAACSDPPKNEIALALMGGAGTCFGLVGGVFIPAGGTGHSGTAPPSQNQQH